MQSLTLAACAASLFVVPLDAPTRTERYNTLVKRDAVQINYYSNGNCQNYVGEFDGYVDSYDTTTIYQSATFCSFIFVQQGTINTATFDDDEDDEYRDSGLCPEIYANNSRFEKVCKSVSSVTVSTAQCDIGQPVLGF